MYSVRYDLEESGRTPLGGENPEEGLGGGGRERGAQRQGAPAQAQPTCQWARREVNRANL